MLRWSLLLEEYGPDIKYVKGTDNDTTDALSRLPLIKSDVKQNNITSEQLAESYGVNKLERYMFPLPY